VVYLSIIIINYKTPRTTLKCIEKIYSDPNHQDYEIIVIDNYSDDDSEILILSIFQEVVWVANVENVGFGQANNIGARHATGEFLLFLNSDVYVETNTISVCLQFMEANDRTGVLGCKLLNSDGSHQKSCYYHVGEYTSLLKDNLILTKFVRFKERQLMAVMGAFMLIPTRVYKEVGGFDPDFFMYAEELELCNRIRIRNYNIHCKDTVSAIHEHGSSSDNVWALKQNLLSTSLLFLKVKGRAGYLLYHIIYIINIITNVLVLWYFEKEIRRNFLKNYRAYFSNLRMYLIIPLKFSRVYGSSKESLKRR